MISVLERGIPGAWSNIMMPSKSVRVNGTESLSSPSTMREATMSGWVPRSSFSSLLIIVLKAAIPGPSQFPAADSVERNECSSARAAVFPLPQCMSGSGLIRGKASLAASRRHASCSIRSRAPSLSSTLGSRRSATKEDFSDSMVWCNVRSIAPISSISDRVCLRDSSLGYSTRILPVSSDSPSLGPSACRFMCSTSQCGMAPQETSSLVT